MDCVKKDLVRKTRDTLEIFLDSGLNKECLSKCMHKLTCESSVKHVLLTIKVLLDVGANPFIMLEYDLTDINDKIRKANVKCSHNKWFEAYQKLYLNNLIKRRKQYKKYNNHTTYQVAKMIGNEKLINLFEESIPKNWRPENHLNHSPEIQKIIMTIEMLRGYVIKGNFTVAKHPESSFPWAELPPELCVEIYDFFVAK